ncbi:Uncharacterised protein [Vibrio cholerae]|uniref:Uncharacterized protein n=1 Tax=Vibrio cholerae TaxID=666 RepID=A0A655VQA4_VIBCL|nr:Uncharacterised protein [Vibrio cholerae]CSB71528.1 Uncharacterised protein [Vibrio cholerae]CSB73023.1 Uncharacterised protein [Vibrio cholerae]CSC07259.1 Uncharacterised protein [Vibrio cholerae]CSC48604.1 Uncharacterised protein [Vibrio cholerae]
MNTADRFFRLIAVSRSNLDRAVIFDLDGGTRFFRQLTNYRTAFTDHVFDLLNADLHRVDTWRKFRDIATRCRDRLIHHRQNV